MGITLRRSIAILPLPEGIGVFQCTAVRQPHRVLVEDLVPLVRNIIVLRGLSFPGCASVRCCHFSGDGCGDPGAGGKICSSTWLLSERKFSQFFKVLK